MKHLISLRICVGSRGRDARLRRWRGVGIPCRKSVQICRAERINDSLLGQTDGHRGKEIVEKMTSERMRVNGMGGRSVGKSTGRGDP